ncbi:hypothetical protein LELG_03292 [Lodderomyces elongisporus NRRL YB-4239]|uniref:Uncharacterized protein n=1 Tax=Lodderomyces elongisporus (strain ATCC 11503 / CBS 2605 / JCM 1781 / NBRC 1676 / NRRL YB-4239) TaxID=379508 RepID=A5E105_LODEL|nr:hypothetical protein LELG_03292 [Lodderomyces elongisporus NRRL YB-4239]
MPELASDLSTTSLSQTNSTWNTLYSYDDGLIYLHLRNNDLLKFSFHLDGSLNSTENLENLQEVTPLTSPPPNTKLFLLNNNLYGLTSKNLSQSLSLSLSLSLDIHENEDKDICGDGQLDLVKYENDEWTNEWSSMNYTNIDDSSFYQDSTILTDYTAKDTVFIYGGLCSSTGLISNRLISLNITNGSFYNVTTSTKPQAFYGASNLAAPNVQNQLIFGGNLNKGWLDMNQLATWNFASGWSFKLITKLALSSKELTINSRINALTLPLFKPLLTGLSITSDFTIDEVLMIGGTMNEKASTPTYAKLNMVTNDVYWNTTGMDNENTLNLSQVLGAATVFSTLIVINSTSIALGESDIKSRRDSDSLQQYQINLYDVDTLKSVDNLKDHIESLFSSKSSYSTSKRNAIILGTILPISSIIIIAVVVYYFYMKKRRKGGNRYEKDELASQYYDNNNELDYSFDYLPHQPPMSHIQPPYINNDHSDSASTLSGATSITSWMRKRQDFEKQRIRASFLASNDTLNIVDDESGETTFERMTMDGDYDRYDITQKEKHQRGAQRAAGDSSNDLAVAAAATAAEKEEEEEDDEQNEEQYGEDNEDATEEDLGYHSRFSPSRNAYSESPLLHKSIRNLRKKYSFTKTPPTSPCSEARPKHPVKYRSLRTTKLEHLFPNDAIDGPQVSNKVTRPGTLHECGSDVTSLDDKFDVQVLVSSKRRSILRIVNPDDNDEDKEVEEEQEEEEKEKEIYNEDYSNKYDCDYPDKQKEETGDGKAPTHMELADLCDVMFNNDLGSGARDSPRHQQLRQRIPSGEKDKDDEEDD